MVGVVSVIRERGDADAEIERKLFLSPQGDNPLSDPLSRVDNALSIGDEENYDELVSSPSEDEVDVSGRVLDGLFLSGEKWVSKNTGSSPSPSE